MELNGEDFIKITLTLKHGKIEMKCKICYDMDFKII